MQCRDQHKGSAWFASLKTCASLLLLCSIRCGSKRLDEQRFAAIRQHPAWFADATLGERRHLETSLRLSHHRARKHSPVHGKATAMRTRNVLALACTIFLPAPISERVPPG